ncbi:hypothetical protein RB195_008910 [Necator americanus]|uniref:Uncharacterized protein n=1 Tax=Necator americanus TaxID=51031 RepID=A0ABR1CQW6_NECAM
MKFATLLTFVVLAVAFAKPSIRKHSDSSSDENSKHKPHHKHHGHHHRRSTPPAPITDESATASIERDNTA